MQNSTSKNKKWIEYFILTVIFLVFSVLPIFIINSLKTTIKQFLPKPSIIKTPCFKFNLNTYFKPTDKNDPKNCTIETKDVNTYLYIAPILFNNLTENSLKQFSDSDKKTFLSTFPKAQIEFDGKIKFAGLSGYGYRATFKPTTKTTKKAMVYWLYNPQSNIEIENIRVKAFSVIIISNPNTSTNIFKDIEQSWQWNTITSNKKDQKDGQSTIKTTCYEIKSKINVGKKYEVNDCDLSMVINY